MSDLSPWMQTLHDMTKDRDAWREMAVELAGASLGLMDVLTSPNTQSRTDAMEAAEAILAKFDEMEKDHEAGMTPVSQHEQEVT